MTECDTCHPCTPHCTDSTLPILTPLIHSRCQIHITTPTHDCPHTAAAPTLLLFSHCCYSHTAALTLLLLSLCCFLLLLPPASPLLHTPHTPL